MYPGLYFLVFWLINLAVLPVIAAEITPNDAFAQAYRVDAEMVILKRHFKITQEAQVAEVQAVLTPRHTWQRIYGVFYRLNILRKKLGLPVMEVPTLEPLLDVKPLVIFEQGLRLLKEIEIIKFHLGISEKTPPPPKFSGKIPTHLFNLYTHISAELDLINGTAFTPNDTFSQAIRLLEDVNAVLEALEIHDNTVPPLKKVGSLPVDSFNIAITVLNEVNRIRQALDLEVVDAKAFEIYKEITSTEVFGLIGMILAELQSVKFRLGIKYVSTPVAKHYEKKVSSDVEQILAWSLRKLQLVRAVD